MKGGGGERESGAFAEYSPKVPEPTPSCLLHQVFRTVAALKSSFPENSGKEQAVLLSSKLSSPRKTQERPCPASQPPQGLGTSKTGLSERTPFKPREWVLALTAYILKLELYRKD